ncbi:MAG: MFS transporter [Gammaproteobacteria bacterium]|jgi:MFS family permease|nr:MFS transporter [Chromatiales bacterium]MDP7271019.1 MFS transporter [Gammaproteobacteria bacterium]MDP7418640.1 MFS transporter [Gammaproteobacteria bacterium]MDP7660882.1 MFS transporter [Gammaproteobacteria bacterium]HJP37718.1 MFS transporter [Gammaproteobacteria bacterium]
MKTDSKASEQEGRRFLFVWFLPGITRLNAVIFCYSAFATIGFLTFISTGTALVLNANFGMPVGEQGTISGDLVIVTEIVQLLIFGFVGVLADRIGRRELFAIGMFVMGIGYLLYPFAESITHLIIYRAVYAAGLGASTGMLQTILTDYPQDRSRGKLVALSGVFNGLGVICVTVLFGRFVPPALVDAGYNAITATRIVHVIVFAVCALSSIVYLFGLKKGAPVEREERLTVKQLIASGFSEAVRNPRIALAYSGAFVARSDLVILGTFVVLWGTVAGVEKGLDPAIAAGRGAGLFGLASAAALIWLGVLGLFMDRINRVTGLIICMALAAIGYSAMWFVDKPLESAAIPWFLLLGVGQISAFFGATALISAEAPRLSRGSVVGAFNMCGAIGIFFASGLGGRLFDSVGPAAPFVLIGVLNAVVMVLAIIVRIKSPGHIPSRDDAGYQL